MVYTAICIIASFGTHTIVRGGSEQHCSAHMHSRASSEQQGGEAVKNEKLCHLFLLMRICESVPEEFRIAQFTGTHSGSLVLIQRSVGWGAHRCWRILAPAMVVARKAHIVPTTHQVWSNCSSMWIGIGN